MAIQEAAAVAGLAATAAAPVEGAVSAGPDAAACGAGIDVDGPGLARVELAAAPGDGGGPDSEGALVDDVEGGCMGDDEEQGKEEEGEAADRCHCCTREGHCCTGRRRENI